jgi:hypothetical protein
LFDDGSSLGIDVKAGLGGKARHEVGIPSSEAGWAFWRGRSLTEFKKKVSKS